MKKNVNKLSLMRSKKRVISILLVLAIIFSMLPTVVLASGGYTADFVVTDESGTAVRGAEITIGSDTQTTNFEGKAQFFLQNGDYSYSVSSVGRLDVTDNTISISDSNITENVELSIDPTGATVTIGSHVTDNLRNEITSFITNHSLENVDITSLTVTGGAISVTDCINIANVPNSNNDLRNTLKKVDFSGTSFVGNKYPSMSLTALSEVILPESVTEIDGSAFWECTYLESINIPQNVTKIGNSAFSGCSSLKHITLPSSVTQIGVGAFQNCTSLTSITLPPDVANIEDYTFMNCNALNSVTLPTNATSIADSAFRDCTHLTTITFPSEITDIGDWAFQGCSLLEKVIFPSGIKKIGSLAFTDCPKLADITLPATVPPTADNSSFRGVPNEALVHVPGGSYSAYHDYDDISTEDCYWCGLYIDDPTKVPVISEAGVQRISDSAAHISFNMDDKLATFYYAVVNEGDPQPVIDTSGPGTGISEFEQCEINVTTLTPGVKDCYIVAKKNGVLSNLLKVKIYAYAVPFDMVISNHKAGSLEQEMNAYLESINCSGAMPFIRTLKVTGGALNAADQDYLGLSMMNWANLTKIDFSGTAFEYNKANDNVMEEGLFAGIVNCGTIILPETVAAISDYAFAGCMSLENITLPSSISAIGIGAFRDCRGLAAITIPASVATIGEYALNDCDSLSYIKMNSSTPPTVGEYAFEGIP
ncbi:MAG TPA: leucine-rich repeat protein, partial [Ruminiclostridium sp.]|nr:leucine-rich repeat protein [Ruminiclostridium sp.]